MTKPEFIEKFEEVLETAKANVRIKGEFLFSSGAVDPESFENWNYALPKIILVAALLDEADNWAPRDKKLRREIANLRHF